MGELVQTYNNLINQLPTSAKSLVRIAVVLLVSALIIKLANEFITRFLFMPNRDRIKIDENKKKTLASLLKSIVRYVTYFMAAMNILEILGINTTSLLTAAGVGGLAVGFGAQTW